MLIRDFSIELIEDLIRDLNSERHAERSRRSTTLEVGICFFTLRWVFYSSWYTLEKFSKMSSNSS